VTTEEKCLQAEEEKHLQAERVVAERKRLEEGKMQLIR
jgi:hypothetical protein